MNNKLGKKGFSLTEVLLAVGTLAIGMLFVAGTFLVAIHFSTIATERTIAAVAADEAFAKIRIYDPNLAGLLLNQQTPLEMIRLKRSGAFFPTDELAYPSTSTVVEKQYYWSALCRPVGPDPNLVQVTVFVCRKVGEGTKYRNPAYPFDISKALAYPVPVEVAVSWPGNKLLDITESGKETFIHGGYTIVDNKFGWIYRVAGSDASQPNRIVLDRPWEGDLTGSVWVVPPPFGGGRYPCIAIYQRVIRF